MNKLIEKLKDKNYVRAFGLMTPDEQECFKKVGKENCPRYNGTSWIVTNCYFTNDSTYCIKPDYQPEFEFVDLEIKEENAGYLFVKYDNKLPYCFSHNNNILPIHCLPSLPKFEYFWYETDTTTRFSFTDDGRVATLRSEGKTVYAKFRK